MTFFELRVKNSSVERDGRLVARLTHAGKQVTVTLPSGRRAGRVFPAGYLQGQASSGGLYDAWTALHPSVHVPSDTVIAAGLSYDDAIRLLLSREEEGS